MRKLRLTSFIADMRITHPVRSTPGDAHIVDVVRFRGLERRQRDRFRKIRKHEMVRLRS
jgi:hypothetical protein